MRPVISPLPRGLLLLPTPPAAPCCCSQNSKKKDVRITNIEAAKAVADAVRTSLGPRGMDKMVRQLPESMSTTLPVVQWQDCPSSWDMPADLAITPPSCSHIAGKQTWGMLPEGKNVP